MVLIGRQPSSIFIPPTYTLLMSLQLQSSRPSQPYGMEALHAAITISLRDRWYIWLVKKKHDYLMTMLWFNRKAFLQWHLKILVCGDQRGSCPSAYELDYLQRQKSDFGHPCFTSRVAVIKSTPIIPIITVNIVNRANNIVKPQPLPLRMCISGLRGTHML